MNSKIRPSHLAGGVAFLVVLVPIVVLSQIDLGRDPGPVIRIRLSDPQPYVPEEAMVFPVNRTEREGWGAIKAEEPASTEGASASGRPSVLSVSASGPEARPSPLGASSSRRSGEQDDSSRAESPQPGPTRSNDEREPVADPRMVDPVRAVPRPRPSEVASRAAPVPAAMPVSPGQRTSEDVQDEEQASGEDVSPTEAAREALRDVRPR